jgi:ferredoxin
MLRHLFWWKNCVALFASAVTFDALSYMADQANKYPENISGQFYVDDQCIDCDLCRETAPANFTRNDDGGHSYVYKQPENDNEAKLCQEAMDGCPVEAIGSDGT